MNKRKRNVPSRETLFTKEFKRRAANGRCQFGRQAGWFCEEKLPVTLTNKTFEETSLDVKTVSIQPMFLCTKHARFKRLNKICDIEQCNNSTTKIYCSRHHRKTKRTRVSDSSMGSVEQQGSNEDVKPNSQFSSIDLTGIPEVGHADEVVTDVDNTVEVVERDTQRITLLFTTMDTIRDIMYLLYDYNPREMLKTWPQFVTSRLSYAPPDFKFEHKYSNPRQRQNIFLTLGLNRKRHDNFITLSRKLCETLVFFAKSFGLTPQQIGVLNSINEYVGVLNQEQVALVLRYSHRRST